MIILGGDSMGLDHGGTAVALACLLLTVFLGQQLINKLENTEWRRNLRALGEKRIDTDAAGDAAGAGAGGKTRGNPKKSKKSA
mmetsp:Transcript_26931/g.90745  ORF Transcript_26931/g.90745 Transcript_26931/m.90745 type:complete len:83 (+) Transcript_26931:1562-1810(+)